MIDSIQYHLYIHILGGESESRIFLMLSFKQKRVYFIDFVFFFYTSLAFLKLYPI